MIAPHLPCLSLNFISLCSAPLEWPVGCSHHVSCSFLILTRFSFICSFSCYIISCFYRFLRLIMLDIHSLSYFLSCLLHLIVASQFAIFLPVPSSLSFYVLLWLGSTLLEISSLVGWISSRIFACFISYSIPPSIPCLIDDWCSADLTRSFACPSRIIVEYIDSCVR